MFWQGDVYSDSLKRNVQLCAVLPEDIVEGEQLKVLYLLHGLFDSCYGWVTRSGIRLWAEEKRIAVIMPSGENSFYVDSVLWPHHDYGEWIGKELPEKMMALFPLSGRKEDTYIGGLSMGGFGALRLGLKYNETFSKIIALSCAIHFTETPEDFDQVFHEEECFGPLDKALGTDMNPRKSVERIISEGSDMPGIYMACGTEDGLLTANRSFRDYLMSKKIELRYEEGPGIHDWEFWNKYLKKAIYEWL